MGGDSPFEAKQQVGTLLMPIARDVFKHERVAEERRSPAETNASSLSSGGPSVHYHCTISAEALQTDSRNGEPSFLAEALQCQMMDGSKNLINRPHF